MSNQTNLFLLAMIASILLTSPLASINPYAFGLIFDPAIEISKPNPQGGTERFGHSVAMNGNHILVGASSADEFGTNSGAAYLFDASGNLLLTFVHPFGLQSTHFGNSVDIEGNNVLIGAQRENTLVSSEFEEGAAYLFDISTCDNDVSNGGIVGDKICESALRFYDSTTVLTPSAANHFGHTLKLSGNNILISAGDYVDIPLGIHTSTVFLFDTSGNLLQTINHSIPISTSLETVSLPIDTNGNYILVGNSFAIDQGDTFGAKLYDTSGNFLRGFGPTIPGLHDTDDFGSAAAISGNIVAIGIPGSDAELFLDPNTGLATITPNPLEPNAGQVWIYDLTCVDSDPNIGCLEPNVILQGNVGENFGTSIDMSGTHVLIGGKSITNTVYLYSTTGVLENIFLEPVFDMDSLFGNSVVMYNNDVLIGAIRAHLFTGSAFLYPGHDLSTTEDSDSDGIANVLDNCPDNFNPDQIDSDGDEIGDVCDLDDDNDGVLDNTDNCPTVSNPNQINTDGDVTGDACDENPTLACGAGTIQQGNQCIILPPVDLDGDGTPDTFDQCPSDTNKISPGFGGCGNPEPELLSCELGTIQQGNECVVDPVITQQNTDLQNQVNSLTQQINDLTNQISDLLSQIGSTPSKIISLLLDDIQSLIEGNNLNEKDSKKIIKELESSLKDIEKGNIKACKDVSKFVKDIDQLVKKGKLLQENAQPLLDEANSLLNSCPVKNED